MVREPEVVVRLRRLQAELATEMSALGGREQEVRDLLARWKSEGSLGRAELVLIAVNLHGWYTALETGLERVARLLDESIPDGPTWHLDLIEQMRIDIPGLRPALIPSESLASLHELRKFRHFFRNAYVLDLDPEKVRARAHDLETAAPSITTALDRFEGELARAIREMVDASV
jgi:hypothetical protein